ncbi:MAG TPA: MFS transporter [Pseudomonadales bacterium]|nr:MFS transporter [Pseudomonadales bacterium]
MRFLIPTARCPNPRSYIVLLLTVMAYGAVNNVVFSILPLIGIELGLAPKQITLIGSCAALTVFLVSPWWGRRSDVWGRRTSILIGVGGYCFSALLLVLWFALSRSGWLDTDQLYICIFASRLLQAFLIAAMLPAITAYVIDITSAEERAVGLSQTGAAHGLGAIIGPSLVVLAGWSLLLPLYVAVGLAMLIAGLVYRYLAEPGKHHDNVYSADSRAMKRPGYFDSRYRHLLLVGVVIYLGMAVSTQMMGFYLPYVLSLDPSRAAGALGLVQACMAAATVFGQLVLVQRLAWSPQRLLGVGLPLMVTGFVLLATAGGLLQLMLSMLFLGLGLGISGPGFSASVSLSVNANEQGAVAGFLAACPALGYVVGPFGAGVLYEWHPRLPFVVVVVFLLAAWSILRLRQG